MDAAEVTDSRDIASDSDSSEEEGWLECPNTALEEEATCLCLFCDGVFRSASETYEHCKTNHGFNIGEAKRRFRFDCLGYIRFINFMRREKPPADQLLPNGEISQDHWQSEIFMTPVIQDDLLLMFDIDDCEPEGNVELDDEIVMLTRKQYNELLQRVQCAETRVLETEEALSLAVEDMTKMRTAAQTFLLSSTDSNPSTSANEDSSYFSAYSHFSIHHDMLHDQVRTESYKDAIQSNPKVFESKTVLDIGCGTGILSLFAAKAGARCVIAVDQSDIIFHAMDIVRENNCEEKIHLLKGRMEEVVLPVEQVDVIVSEWMGYFLLFECMLDTVIYARDKYLSPEGVMMPNRCTISLMGISDLERHRKLVTFWDNVYGYKMSCMKGEVVKEACIEVIDPETIVTTAAMVKDIDINVCTVNDVEFTADFTLSVLQTAPIVAIVGFFDVFFDLQEKVYFSTSPSSTPTHWKQSVFYIENPLFKNAGDVINGNILCQRNRKDPRTLLVTLQLDQKRFHYVVQ